MSLGEDSHVLGATEDAGGCGCDVGSCQAGFRQLVALAAVLDKTVGQSHGPDLCALVQQAL